MILQLNPSIPLVTPKGSGMAWAMIDYGPEHNIMWVVAIDSTGEIWTYGNPEVRAQKNISLGRINDTSSITPDEEYCLLCDSAEFCIHKLELKLCDRLEFIGCVAPAEVLVFLKKFIDIFNAEWETHDELVKMLICDEYENVSYILAFLLIDKGIIRRGITANGWLEDEKFKEMLDSYASLWEQGKKLEREILNY